MIITKIAFSRTLLPRVSPPVISSVNFRIQQPLPQATLLSSLRPAKRFQVLVKASIVLEVQRRFSVALGGARLAMDRTVPSGRACYLGRVSQRRTGCGKLLGESRR